MTQDPHDLEATVEESILRVALGSGPEKTFSAPSDARGHAGVLTPHVRIGAGVEEPAVVEARTRRALDGAQKHRRVAHSVTPALVVEPSTGIPGEGHR